MWADLRNKRCGCVVVVTREVVGSSVVVSYAIMSSMAAAGGFRFERGGAGDEEK